MAKDDCAYGEAPWDKRLDSEGLLAEYQGIDDHLTAELCKLSLHLANFVERRLVSEAVDRITPRSEEGFRLGNRMMQVGSALLVDARRRGAEVSSGGQEREK